MKQGATAPNHCSGVIRDHHLQLPVIHRLCTRLLVTIQVQPPEPMGIQHFVRCLGSGGLGCPATPQFPVLLW